MEYKSTNINYTLTGSGTKYVLFLHGWGGSIDSFKWLQQQLEPQFKCLNIDLPPFGKSEEPNSSWTVQDYALMVLKLLRSLNIQKVNIVCHSFGCRIALYLAGLTQIVDKMVITAGAGLKPRRSLVKSFKVFKFKLAKMSVKLRLKPVSYLEQFGSSDYRALSPVMKQTFKNIVNFDQTDMLKYIKCATILVWGKDDDQTPIYMARKMQKHIQDCELIEYEGGHFVYLEHYREFYLIVQKFFS